MTGLLAGLWEFPGLLQEETSSDHKHKEILSAEVNRILGTCCTGSLLQDVGEVGFMSPTDLPQTHIDLFNGFWNLSLSLSIFFSLFAGCSHFLPHPPDARGSQFVFERHRHTYLQWKCAVAHQICTARSCCVHGCEKGVCIFYFSLCLFWQCVCSSAVNPRPSLTEQVFLQKQCKCLFKDFF